MPCNKHVTLPSVLTLVFILHMDFVGDNFTTCAMHELGEANIRSYSRLPYNIHGLSWWLMSSFAWNLACFNRFCFIFYIVLKCVNFVTCFYQSSHIDNSVSLQYSIICNHCQIHRNNISFSKVVFSGTRLPNICFIKTIIILHYQ